MIVALNCWLWPLHMARILGLPYKYFVCLMGQVVAMLSVTGVYIWLKKRRARCISKKRRTRLL
ncbi:MAG: PepSY domain-containing protein [Methylococcaceae bacterium]